MPNEKSSSFSVSKRFFWFSVSTEYARDSVSFGVSTSSTEEFTMSPSTRIFGRSPATMWRSEASFSIISSSRARRFTGIAWSPSSGRFLHDLFESRDSLLDLHHSVHPQRQHPVLDALVPQLFRRGALQHQAPQRARHQHHLVQPLPALVPRAVAGVAALALEERAVLALDGEGVQLLVGVSVLLLAAGADAPHQPLRHDQVHRARHVERLDPHVHHARHGRRRVVGMQRGQHQVARDRKSTRLNSSHEWISYAVFCLKKKKK